MSEFKGITYIKIKPTLHLKDTMFVFYISLNIKIILSLKITMSKFKGITYIRVKPFLHLKGSLFAFTIK